MKSTLITLTCLLSLITSNLLAQTRFVKSGTIEYNKSANIFALMNKELLGYGDNNNTFGTQAYDAYKKKSPSIRDPEKYVDICRRQNCYNCFHVVLLQ